ncbi:MAG TPA: hypothetical protein VGM62_06210 [Chthoniobacterales bacterium]
MVPKTILIDCDGVLTDGALTIDHRGEKMFKRFHTRDVRAIRELIYNGFEVTIVSADDWPGIYRFADKVGADVRVCRDKSKVGAPPFVAIGDDTWDLPMLRRAGKGNAFCPADADRAILESDCVIALKTSAGHGVIAELARYLLTPVEIDSHVAADLTPAA